MTTDEILKLWEEDAVINDLDLVNESLKVPRLHAKYFRIYMQEIGRMVQYSNNVKTLHLEKYEFYTQGPNSETPEGWELPASGRVLKTEVPQYLDADKDMVLAKTKLEMQKQKIKLLESIITSINNRGFAIKNSIDMIKFQAGSN